MSSQNIYKYRSEEDSPSLGVPEQERPLDETSERILCESVGARFTDLSSPDCRSPASTAALSSRAGHRRLVGAVRVARERVRLPRDSHTRVGVRVKVGVGVGVRGQGQGWG